MKRVRRNGQLLDGAFGQHGTPEDQELFAVERGSVYCFTYI